VAERDGEAVGFALGRTKGKRLGYLSDLFVTPGARGDGVARALMVELATRLAADGADVIELEVQARNAAARAVYERWGFTPTLLTLATPISQLTARLARQEEHPSFGSTHVQSDDEAAVERAVTRFLPRLGRSQRTEVTPARNGWVTVYDERCDRDRAAHRRLGAELSERLGVPVVALRLEEEAVVRFLLFERGRMVDEYLSVPTYYGELSKVDELSFAANPTLVARLTGADPKQVRAVARTASTMADLPPAPELLAAIADVMGLEVERRDRG
jgi:predicted GNAT family acetyltransferase